MFLKLDLLTEQTETWESKCLFFGTDGIVYFRACRAEPTKHVRLLHAGQLGSTEETGWLARIPYQTLADMVSTRFHQ